MRTGSRGFCIAGLPPSDLSINKMILTQCAVCATELGLSLGKKMRRCSTRYCGPECQVQHWKEGGHDQLCKPIKKQAVPSSTTQIRNTRRPSRSQRGVRGGHEGPDVLHLHASSPLEDEEGLVRGCSCRGTAGFAHVSCLVEQAKILVAEAEENNLGNKVMRGEMGHGGTSARIPRRREVCTGGRAGRRTWGGRRRTRFITWR